MKTLHDLGWLFARANDQTRELINEFQPLLRFLLNDRNRGRKRKSFEEPITGNTTEINLHSPRFPMEFIAENGIFCLNLELFKEKCLTLFTKTLEKAGKKNIRKNWIISDCQLLITSPGCRPQFLHRDGLEHGAYGFLLYLTPGNSTDFSVLKKVPQDKVASSGETMYFKPRLTTSFSVQPGDFSIIETTTVHRGPGLSAEANSDRLVFFMKFSDSQVTKSNKEEQKQQFEYHVLAKKTARAHQILSKNGTHNEDQEKKKELKKKYNLK